VLMKDHVIVVGLGNVGYRTVQSLVFQGKEVVVIDLAKASTLSSILPRSVPYLCGDGRDPMHLELASIRTARAIIATTQDDSVNLAVGFSAKKIAPNCRAVVRLFDGNFARKVEANTVIERAMSASFLSAPGFVAGALFPGAVFGFTDGEELMVILADGASFSVERVRLAS
ncbi:MAG TPA: NAD(P)-binding protein, partial [Fimbriimonas sp.]|nr:NAD(P)-binding protein [Fimbriimonas sp.]